MIVAPPPKLALFVHFSCDSQAGIHAQKRTPLHNPTARITKRTQFVLCLQQTPPERHKNAYTPEEGSPRRPLAVSPALTSTPCVHVGTLRAHWRAQLAFRGLQCRLEERMFTATADLILPSTTTGSFPRPRWFDVSMWGRPLDTCMLDVRFREKFQDAMAVLISDQERAGLDILTHGDLHVDEDMAGRAWHHYPLQRWAGFEGDHLQPEETTAPWLHYPPGTLLNEIYTGWRWPHVVDKIEHRSLDYAKLWRIAQGKTRKSVKFGTCCSQVMALFLDIHTPKYKDKREVIWDMAVAMNKELLSLRAAGCRCIQIEEPTFHFMANTYGKDHDEVKFMIDAFNREVQGLDDVEVWIHTCWGNPNMQRVMEDTSYANSIEIYL